MASDHSSDVTPAASHEATIDPTGPDEQDIAGVHIPTTIEGCRDIILSQASELQAFRNQGIKPSTDTAALRREIASLKSEKSDFVRVIEGLRSESAASADSGDARKRISNLERELEILNAENTREKEKNADFRAEIEQVHRENNEFKVNLAESLAKIQEYEKEAPQVSSINGSSGADGNSSAVTSLQIRLKEVEESSKTEITQYEAQVQELETLLSAFQNGTRNMSPKELSNALQQRDEMEVKLQSYDAEHLGLQQELSLLADELNTCKDQLYSLQSSNMAKSEHDHIVAAMKSETRSLQQELDHARGNSEHLHANMEALKSLVSSDATSDSALKVRHIRNSRFDLTRTS